MPKVVHKFSELGIILFYGLKAKLYTRAKMARYLYGIDTRHCLVEVLNSHQRKILRHLDFRQYYPVLDPKYLSNYIAPAMKVKSSDSI